MLALLAMIPEGCSFAPCYHQPPLPVAEYYPGEICECQPTNVNEIDWHDFFNDPILCGILEVALENNRDLRVALHRMEEAWAIYGIRRSDLFPHLNAVSDNLQMRLPPNILPHTPAFILSAFMLSLNVSNWELDFWGRIRNLKDEALEEYLASGEAERALCVSLIDQVANAYLFACELNELIEIAKRTLASREKSYDLMRDRYNEGSSSKYEFIESKTLLTQAEVELTSLERMRALNWNALTLLVGAPVQPDCRLLSQIEPTFVYEIFSGLPSELLCNRPDILAAEHRLRAAHFDIGAARAAFFPRISLTGFLGTASSALSGLFGPGSFFWAYSPDLAQPLFDASLRRSQLWLSNAHCKVVVAEYEKTIQNAFREVADALAERSWYSEQVAFQREAVEEEIERAELAWFKFEQGSAPFLDVLDAEREKFTSEQELVKDRRALLSSSVNLYSALGGGICCR